MSTRTCCSTDLNSLLFEIDDFNGFTFGGEWLFAVDELHRRRGRPGFYQKTVPSIYADFDDSDGTEIEQDLKLRIIPITATVRFLPLGRSGRSSPISAPARHLQLALQRDGRVRRLR